MQNEKQLPLVDGPINTYNQLLNDNQDRYKSLCANYSEYSSYAFIEKSGGNSIYHKYL